MSRGKGVTMKSAKHWNEETEYLCSVLRDAIAGSRSCGGNFGAPLSLRDVPSYLGVQAASARRSRFYGLAIVLDDADTDAQNGNYIGALERIEAWRAGFAPIEREAS